jgi:hypothetical protein
MAAVASSRWAYGSRGLPIVSDRSSGSLGKEDHERHAYMERFRSRIS